MANRSHLPLISCLLILFFLVSVAARAQGGPPLLTDDPDTPGPGYWEINLSTALERSRQERQIEAPRVDINYGVGQRIQLKFEIPWLRRELDGESRSGAGNSVTGVKWRFLGQEGQLLAWSVYPQLELNTGHAAVANGLVEADRQFFLPTEFTLEFRHVEINGEVGRTFVQRGENSWRSGVSTEGKINPRLELLAELHDEQSGADPAEIVATLGARQKLTRQLVLLMSAGRALRGLSEERPHLLAYVALQLNFPHILAVEPKPAARRRPGR